MLVFGYEGVSPFPLLVVPISRSVRACYACQLFQGLLGVPFVAWIVHISLGVSGSSVHLCVVGIVLR